MQLFFLFVLFVAANAWSIPFAMVGRQKETSLPLENFVVYGKPGLQAPIATQVRLHYDNEKLYLAIRCQEPVLDSRLNQLHKFKEQCREADNMAVYQDENIEIFLDTGQGAYQYFIINPSGTVYDARGGSADWDAAAQISTRRDEGNWYLDLALPLEQKIEPGVTVWRANFCRTRRVTGEKECYSWSPAPGGFHQPASFAELRFVSELPADRPPFIELNFDNGDFVQLQTPCPIHPQKRALSATFGTNGEDKTETFLKGTQIPVQPGKQYQFSVVVKATFKGKTATPYQFFWLYTGKKKQQIIYAPVDGLALRGNENTWRQIRGIWTAPEGVESVIPHLIKWAGRQLQGELSITDLSMKELGDDKELLNNGDFSQGKIGWPTLRHSAPGYGYGANSVRKIYGWKGIYRSPEYLLTLQSENPEISSLLAWQSAINQSLLPLQSLTLATGSPEKVELFLKSSHTRPDKVILELQMPLFMQLLNPEGQTEALTPISIVESISDSLRSYQLVFDSRAVSHSDTPDWMRVRVPLLFSSVGVYQEQTGRLQYRATLNDSTEAWHYLPVKMLPPLAGKVPKTLPLVSWVYPGNQDFGELSPQHQRLFALKQLHAGFNTFMVPELWLNIYRELDAKTAVMLPTVTISGNFPGCTEYLQQNPQFSARHPDQQAANAVCPAHLLEPQSPFLKVMENTFQYFTENYDFLVWDYEFPFMPGHGNQRRAQIGFSDTNLKLFRTDQKIPAEIPLDARIIWEKYPEAWRDFRNRQIAAAFQIYRDLLKKQNPSVCFSAYSGYPPHSHEHYGIDWRYVSQYVDLVMAGYGGNNQQLLDSLSPAHRYCNSGLLLMEYFDPATTELTMGRMLQDAGSYMAYYHYLVDGKFFQGMANCAALAADYERFFLQVRGQRHEDFIQGAPNLAVLAWEDEYLALIPNPASTTKTFHLTATPELERLDGFQSECTVSQQSMAAMHLMPVEKLRKRQAPMPALLPSSEGYCPVLRWKIPSADRCRFTLRYSRHPLMEQATTIDHIRNCFYQLPELDAGTVYWQVRTISPHHSSAWSPVFQVKVRTYEPQNYSQPAELNDKLFFPQWFGSAGTRVDPSRLHVVNHLATMAFFTNARSNHGCNKPILVKKGERYRLSAYIRTSGQAPNANISLALHDFKNNRLDVTSSPLIKQECDWQKVECELQVAQEGILKFYLSATGSLGETQFKDVKLIQSNNEKKSQKTKVY